MTSLSCPLCARPEEIRLSQFVVMTGDIDKIKAILKELRQFLRDMCAVGMLEVIEYEDKENSDLVFKLKWSNP